MVAPAAVIRPLHAPSMLRTLYVYWRYYGLRVLAGRCLGVAARLVGRLGVAARARLRGLSGCRPVRELLDERFAAVAPLHVYQVPEPGPRVTLLASTLGDHDLDEGSLAPPLILATLLAERWDAALRIITGRARVDGRALAELLGRQRVCCRRDLELEDIGAGRGQRQVSVRRREIFITTSWSTSAAAAASLDPRQVVYLVQEDERMRHPFGDDHLRCSALLASRRLHLAISTRLLYEHLASQGLEHLRDTGVWFEPPILGCRQGPRAGPDGGRRAFLVLARGHDPMTLVELALEVADRAIAGGALDPGEWELYLPPETLPMLSARRWRALQGAGWQAWPPARSPGEGLDLGLFLRYSAHPGQALLEAVAGGAVVITNRHGIRRDLAGSPANVLWRATDVDSLVAGIAEGAALARRGRAHSAERPAGGPSSSWEVAYQPVLRYIDEVARDVRA